MTPGRVIRGLVLIVIGALLLGGTLGWVSWSFLASLWRLWPIILIIIGIELLLSPRRPALAAILMVIVVLAGVGIAFAGWGGAWDGLTSTEIDGPAASGISAASASIRVGAVKLSIEDGSSGRLVEGTFRTRREPAVSARTIGSEYQLEVGEKGGSFGLPFGSGGDERLDLRLAPRVPWSLNLDSGAADVDVDLTDLRLQALDLDAGASSVDITLGSDVVEGARVSVSGGAGSYHLRVPTGLNARVTVKGGLSSKDIADGFVSRGEDVYEHDGGGSGIDIRIDSGVSSVTVELY